MYGIVTLNGKTLSNVRELGYGANTYAYASTDRRYRNGEKVLLYSRVYDVVKQGISNALETRKRINVHIPIVRRIGVGYDSNGNFCLVYESPFYNVFADSYGSTESDNARLQYESISDNLPYYYGNDISAMRYNIESMSGITANIRNALLDILDYSESAMVDESEWYGADFHSGNGAYDSKGRLILLDVFHQGGIDAQTYVQLYESENEKYIIPGNISDYDSISDSEYASSLCNCTACRRARGYVISTYRICAPWTPILRAPLTRVPRAPLTRVDYNKTAWIVAPCTRFIACTREILVHVWIVYNPESGYIDIPDYVDYEIRQLGFTRDSECHYYNGIGHGANYNDAAIDAIQRINNAIGFRVVES